MSRQQFRTLLALLCFSFSIVLFQNCDPGKFQAHGGDSYEGFGPKDDSHSGGNQTLDPVSGGSSFTCLPAGDNPARILEIHVEEWTGVHISIRYTNDQNSVTTYKKNNVSISNQVADIDVIINGNTHIKTFDVSQHPAILKYTQGSDRTLEFNCY